MPVVRNRHTGRLEHARPGDPIGYWTKLPPTNPLDLRPRGLNQYYTTQFSNERASNNLGNVVGNGRMGVFFAGGIHTWDRITAVPGTVGTLVVRIGVYSLNPSTLLPDALLLDAGTVGVVDLTSDLITINLTTNALWLGLAGVVETVGTGSLRVSQFLVGSGFGGFQLFGLTDPPVGTSLEGSNFLSCATGVAGLPGPSAWSYSIPFASDAGVCLRKSA